MKIEFSAERKKRSLIDIAPLVDVMFILLLFFMLGSDFVKSVLALSLPKAGSRQAGESTSVIVTVDNLQRIYINNSKSSYADFNFDLNHALAESNNRDVLFRGDQEMKYSNFIKVLDQIKKSNVDNFTLEIAPDGDTKRAGQ